MRRGHTSLSERGYLLTVTSMLSSPPPFKSALTAFLPGRSFDPGHTKELLSPRPPLYCGACLRFLTREGSSNPLALSLFTLYTRKLTTEHGPTRRRKRAISSDYAPIITRVRSISKNRNPSRSAARTDATKRTLGMFYHPITLKKSKNNTERDPGN